MLGICMMLNALSVVYLWIPDDPPPTAQPGAAPSVAGSENVDRAVQAKAGASKKEKKAEKKAQKVVEDKREEQPPTDRPIAHAYPTRRRPSHFALALRLLPLLTSFAGFALYKNAPFAEDGVRIHKSVASVTGRVVVGDNLSVPENAKYRFLRNDKTLIGGMWLQDNNDPTGMSARLGDSVFAAFHLQEVCVLARPPKKDDKALVLGLGAGIGASYLHKRGLDVTVVEVDPAVASAAKDYFGLPDVKVDVEDGALWVYHAANGSTKYDYIIHDVFSTGGLPAPLFTKEFWAEAKRILSDDGVLVVNMVGPLHGPLTRRIVATLTSEFPQCRAFTDHPESPSGVKNFVFVCSPNALPTFAKATRADTLGSPMRERVFGSNKFEEGEVKVAEFLKTENEAELEEDVIIRRGEKREGKWDLDLANAVWDNVRNCESIV